MISEQSSSSSPKPSFVTGARACAPGKVNTPLAAAKHAIRALARRRQQLDAEIADHDEIVDELTQAAAPRMREAFGIGPDTSAEMLILAGDRPAERLRSEPAFAKLCGAAPIPASSGMNQRHRLNPAGNRQANSALYRTVIVRMRFHPATIAYVDRRTKEGKSKREIIRCLKRYVAREIYHMLLADSPVSIPTPPQQTVTIMCGNPGSGITEHDLDKHRSVNAVAETFFATLKKELVNRRSWPSRLELQSAVFEYIEAFYNRQRRHSTLGMLSPVAYNNYDSRRSAVEIND